jgi:hypothetical protein
MAGDLSYELDRKVKAFADYRQKIGPENLDAFTAKYSYIDAGQHISHAAPAAVSISLSSMPILHSNISRLSANPRS